MNEQSFLLVCDILARTNQWDIRKRFVTERKQFTAELRARNASFSASLNRTDNKVSVSVMQATSFKTVLPNERQSKNCLPVRSLQNNGKSIWFSVQRHISKRKHKKTPKKKKKKKKKKVVRHLEQNIHLSMGPMVVTDIVITFTSFNFLTFPQLMRIWHKS